MFQLVLNVPTDSAAATLRVFGTPVVARLAIAAARAGASHITVRGDQCEEARAILRSDERLAGVTFGEATDLPVIEAAPDALVSTRAIRMLATTDDAFVPQAPSMRRGTGLEPLWDEPPAGCWAVALSDSSELAEAKRVVFANARSTSSSPVARLLNERLSGPISRVFADTAMTPNQMTLLNTIVGVVGAWFCARGDLASLAVGGVLMQLTAILDCCDGEMARAKMLQSERGAWIDTAGDNVIYLAYVLGLTVGYVRFAEAQSVVWAPWVPLVGAGVFALATLLIGGMLLYVKSHRLGGSLTVIHRDFADETRSGSRAWARLQAFFVQLGRRAQFSLMLAIAAVLPWLLDAPVLFHALYLALVVFVASASLYFVAGSIQRRRRHALLERVAR